MNETSYVECRISYSYQISLNMLIIKHPLHTDNEKTLSCFVKDRNNHNRFAIKFSTYPNILKFCIVLGMQLSEEYLSAVCRYL